MLSTRITTSGVEFQVFFKNNKDVKFDIVYKNYKFIQSHPFIHVAKYHFPMGIYLILLSYDYFNALNDALLRSSSFGTYKVYKLKKFTFLPNEFRYINPGIIFFYFPTTA